MPRGFGVSGHPERVTGVHSRSLKRYSEDEARRNSTCRSTGSERAWLRAEPGGHRLDVQPPLMRIPGAAAQLYIVKKRPYYYSSYYYY